MLELDRESESRRKLLCFSHFSAPDLLRITLSVFLQISSMPHLLLAFLTVSNVIVVFGGADNCPPMDELTNILEKYTPEVNVVNRQKNDTSSSSTFR